MAVYCCCKPAALLAVAGVICTDTKVAAVTLKVALFELMPLSDAVMVTAPTATAVPSPLELMVALLVSLEFHDTDVDKSVVLRSVYRPVAVYCWTKPAALLAVAGVI